MKIYTTAEERAAAYSANFAWFWYNDEEIFHDTQEDIDRKMKAYADQGVTHVMTFSCTHFRWSFLQWWPQILECLRKIASAGHKYGVKVIEHSSAVLTWFPNTPSRLENFIVEQHIRKSDLGNWPGLVEYMLDESREDHKWDQIRIGTEDYQPSTYSGFAKCLNNPDYLKAYLDYLTLVCQSGVDGIMTDDARFYPGACGCRHCRELFRKEYGWELPSADEYEKWMRDMNNHAFIDYRHFIEDSQHRFFQAINDHFNALGYDMLRPNYDAVAMGNFRYIDALDDVPRMDWLFQECMFSAVIRYSWHGFVQEQLHKAMVARERDIPHMMMFYANRQDSLVFAWAIAKYCGALFNNTPEGGCRPDETQLRNFEKQYGKWLFDSREVPSVAFLDSKANRRFSTGYMESRRIAWMQACIFNNIPAVMVSIKNPESWKTHPLVSANEVHLLSKEEIDNLRSYAENGGILVLTGRCGQLDENSRFRSEEERARLWNIDFASVPPDGIREFPCGKGKIVAVGWNYGYPGTEEENRLRFDDDPRRWKESFITPRKELLHCILRRWDKNGETLSREQLEEEDSHYYRMMPYYGMAADLFRTLLKGRLSLETELPELVVASLKKRSDGKGYAVHLVNAAGTYHKDRNGKVSHADVIEFPAWPGGDGKVMLRLDAELKNASAVFCDLRSSRIPLKATANGNSLELVVPSGVLKDYGLITISCE